jgi:hypothetical protein
MEIIDNKVLLVRTRDPGRITTAIKKSAEVDQQGDRCVPDSAPESVLL